MTFLRQVMAIVWKDVVTELRTREMLGAMLVFAVLVILIFNFAIELRVEKASLVAPGVLWVAFTFAGMLGLGRSFIVEKDRGCIDGLLLCPADRSVIYLGKVIGNVLFMSIVEAIILPITIALFNLPFEPAVLLVVVLGTVGFAAVGTLFSAMAVHTRAREVMLPILLFPIVVPAMIAAVKLTGGLLDGLSLSELGNWLQLLIAFDVIFLTVSYLTFDYMIEE